METLEYGKSKRLITANTVLGEVFRNVRNIFSKTDLPTIIQGETGTGKEGVARALYWHGDRNDKPFVAVNCGGIPEGLVESEFFGHEKGAFSGATSRRRGHFEEANGGTLFLDEIAELPLGLQARLLRVLQEGEIVRVGSSRAISVNVRIVAATNKDLKQLIDDGKFRADLYYRLAAHIIAIPALRDRPEDIESLADLFIREGNERFGTRVIGIKATAIKLLARHSWPGNVRELQNVIWTAVSLHIKNKKQTKINSADLTSVIKQLSEQAENLPPCRTETLEKVMLTYLTDHGAVSTRDMVKALDRDRFAIMRQVAKLEKSGVVVVKKRMGRNGNLVTLDSSRPIESRT